MGTRWSGVPVARLALWRRIIVVGLAVEVGEA